MQGRSGPAEDRVGLPRQGRRGGAEEGGRQQGAARSARPLARIAAERREALSDRQVASGRRRGLDAPPRSVPSCCRRSAVGLVLSAHGPALLSLLCKSTRSPLADDPVSGRPESRRTAGDQTALDITWRSGAVRRVDKPSRTGWQAMSACCVRRSSPAWPLLAWGSLRVGARFG